MSINRIDYVILGCAVLAAFVGAAAGNQRIRTFTMDGSLLNPPPRRRRRSRSVL